MNAVDIAFVSPPTRSTSPRPPLGAMCMSSFLEENGVSTAIVDVKGIEDREKAREKTIRETVKLNPAIVGLTCLTPEVLEIRKTAKRLKQLLPNAKLLVGGVHTTLIPADLIFKGSQMDFAVLGEGEETCLELVQAIAKKRSLKKVKGLAFLNKSNKLVRTEPRPLIKDLSKMPMPAFEKIPMDFYTKPGIYCIRGVPISGFYVFTSRGCPYRCEFCVNKNIFGRVIRYKDPLKVVDEIGLLAEKYKIDGFYIYDDTFTVNRKHVETICNQLKERKLDLLWACETRVNLVYDDLMRKMKQTGCVQIDFGVESGSPANLVRLKKDITVEQIRNAFKICKKQRIRTFANFMLNTPNETRKDVQMTIDLAKELNANVSIFNVTTPYPGTDIYEKIGGVPLEDYETLGPTPESFNKWIALLESKYKFSEHDMDIGLLVKDLMEEFPSIHSLSFKDPKYVMKFLGNISFLFSWPYIRTLLKSRRKREYLQWLLQLKKFLKAQKNIEG